MKIECPAYDCSCPYCCIDSNCCIKELEGIDPEEECDAFFEMEDVEEDYEMGFSPYLGYYTDDC